MTSAKHACLVAAALAVGNIDIPIYVAGPAGAPAMGPVAALAQAGQDAPSVTAAPATTG